MITRKKITEILETYDPRKLTIATIGSHSALQIFHGARLEGFRSLNICTRDRQSTYEAFPLSRAEKFIVVDSFKDILRPDIQSKLIEENAVVVPHGSFVEYVGTQDILDRFEVPMFGNRESLAWEADRKKQRKWLESAGLRMPREYKDPLDIDRRVFVKFSGARGGRGFFIAENNVDFHEKLEDRIKKGLVKAEDVKDVAIQEFVAGVRYYPHYFASPLEKCGLPLKTGSLELLSMDKRIEPIDESYRGLPEIPEEFFDYTVTGNQSVIVRESLLPEVLAMGARTVEKSVEIFSPGMIGPFSLEAVFSPVKGFTVFEISARIVAGTNLFPTGSPYSSFLYEEPMSTGRRIARELRSASERNMLDRIVF